MPATNILANLFVTLYNNETRRKSDCVILPTSKLGVEVLKTLQKDGYIGEFEHIDEKRGFSPELWFDWKQNGKKIFEKYIFDKDCKIIQKGLINSKWISKSFETIENDGSVRYLTRLTSILALEVWYRTFISKEMNVDEKLK